MSEVGWVHAWKLWIAGEQLTTLHLWGVSILWWGRIGKLISLCSAITIVVDFIGPLRLRAFGQSLREGIFIDERLRRLRSGIRWYGSNVVSLWHLVAAGGATRRREQRMQLPGLREYSFRRFEDSRTHVGADPLHRFNLLISALLAALLLASAVPFQITVGSVIGFLLSLYGLYYILSPAVILAIAALYWLSAVTIDAAVIAPVARLLESTFFERIVLATSLFLLLLGFHFDLLAS